MDELKCVNCKHYHARTEPQLCTNMYCTCDESNFIPLSKSVDFDGAKSFEYYQNVIQNMTDIYERIRYMLEFIPDMRNTDDWEFVNQYWHYYLNFCTGMPYTTEIYNRIHNEAEPDDLTRMRRKVCEPERQAIILLQQEIIDDKLDENSPRYWSIQSEIKQIIKDAKYLPTDMKLLRAKGIKETAVKEALLETV